MGVDGFLQAFRVALEKSVGSLGGHEADGEWYGRHYTHMVHDPDVAQVLQIKRSTVDVITVSIRASELALIALSSLKNDPQDYSQLQSGLSSILDPHPVRYRVPRRSGSPHSNPSSQASYVRRRQILNAMGSGSCFVSESHVKFKYTTCLSKETYIVTTDSMPRKTIKQFPRNGQSCHRELKDISTAAARSIASESTALFQIRKSCRSLGHWRGGRLIHDATFTGPSTVLGEALTKQMTSQ